MNCIVKELKLKEMINKPETLLSYLWQLPFTHCAVCAELQHVEVTRGNIAFLHASPV